MLTAVVTFCVVTICTFYFYSKKKDPEKIFGVYSQPGKWYSLKYYIFFCILTIRKIKSKIVQNQGQDGNVGLGKGIRSDENLEKLQPLSSHEKAFDAVFFHGANFDGYYFCGGTERRHKAKVNGLFYILVPELGLLRSEKLPETTLDTNLVSILKNDCYSAEGICFKPVKAMKTWAVSYNGQMRSVKNPDQLIDVKFEAEWTSSLPYFLFDTDMSTKALARAIARETWSSEYFQALKDAHQTHYEQMGKLKGSLTINGENREINMEAFRDHSFGHKRDWLLMHRYTFHMIFLKDGTKMAIGVVSQPCTTSHLEMGYVVYPNKTTVAIDNCDLLLYQHGENGNPGKNIAFTITAGKKSFEVRAMVEHEAVHYVGNNVEAKMIERFLKYTVNGVEGIGIGEWHYNNVKSYNSLSK